MTTRLDEIRQRLEAATPGPWLINAIGDIESATRVEGRWRVLATVAHDSDCRFVADAPDDIAWLVDRVEEQDEACVGHRYTIQQLIEANRLMAAKNDELRTLLGEVAPELADYIAEIRFADYGDKSWQARHLARVQSLFDRVIAARDGR